MTPFLKRAPVNLQLQRDRYLASFILRNNLAFKLMNDKQLNEMADSHFPGTHQTDRTTLSKRIIPDMYYEFVAEKTALLKDKHFSITADLWTRHTQKLLRLVLIQFFTFF